MTTSSNLHSEYEQFQKGQGYFVDTEATVIQLNGSDSKSFLHNFCTADIKGLEPGNSTEAFILNGKGKTLFFVQVLCFDDYLMLVIPQAQSADLIAHLSRYVIVEDVTIESPANIQVVYASFEHESSFVCQIGENRWISVWTSGLAEEVFGEDRTEIQRETFEAIRIEKGFPISGVDVTDDCLAQEFERDASAISYTKGCYLGQETVARLDALGHTNRSFCLAKSESSEMPDLESELIFEDKKCGAATSAGWSPKHECNVVLAMVKKPHHSPGSVLQLGGQNLTVVALDQ